jgi:hypothetical protein
MKTSQVEKGFRVELVACEPMIQSPVAMSFDDQGRLYVCEMRGYMHDKEGAGERSRRVGSPCWRTRMAMAAWTRRRVFSTTSSCRVR